MIRPGLERIGALLKNVDLPWKAVHVAGTNGKGSICATTSALLTRRKAIKNGRFTSPHLVHRWDCITINDKTINEDTFKKVESHFIQLSERENINASPFEILTATAFQIFTDSNVKVGVVEVGMGGKLDATNILNNQVVSVISKIAHDHQQFLGDSLTEIARHKAGILRPAVPYIVNPRNEQMVQMAISDVARQIGAGPRISMNREELYSLYTDKKWESLASSLSSHQRDNLVLAYNAFLTTLESLGEELGRPHKLLLDVAKRKTIPGRYQRLDVRRVFGRGRQILVDGAHNTDGAQALAAFVAQNIRSTKETRNNSGRARPITWVVAMSEGKDAHSFLRPLLGPDDMIVTTTFGPVDGMPWVKPMDPFSILKAARDINPDVLGLATDTRGVHRALNTARYLTDEWNPIVLTGSLYLVGNLFREMELLDKDDTAIDYRAMEREEKTRVAKYLTRLREMLSAEVPQDHSGQLEDMSRDVGPVLTSEPTEEKQLQQEIDELNKQLESLEKEEARIKESTPPAPAMPEFPSLLKDKNMGSSPTRRLSIRYHATKDVLPDQIKGSPFHQNTFPSDTSLKTNSNSFPSLGSSGKQRYVFRINKLKEEQVSRTARGDGRGSESPDL